MDFDYFGPMELYEKDGKKYFGTKKWYYTFDDKKDQIIYNYDNSKSTFMKKININYFNKTFCKDRCNLEVYLFATDGHPEMPRNKVHTFFVKNPPGIDLSEDNPTLVNGAWVTNDPVTRITMKVHEYLNDYIRLPNNYNHGFYTRYLPFDRVPMEFGNKLVYRCQGKGTKCLYATGCTDNFQKCCPKHCTWDEKKQTIVGGDIDCRNCWLYYKNKNFVDNYGKGREQKINWFTDNGWRTNQSKYNDQRRDLVFSKSLIDAVNYGDKGMFDQLFENSDITIKEIGTKNWSALVHAIKRGREYMVKKILEKADREDISIDDLVENDWFDYDALYLAVSEYTTYNKREKIEADKIVKRHNIVLEVAKRLSPTQIRDSLDLLSRRGVDIQQELKDEVNKILEKKLKNKVCDDSEYTATDSYGDGCSYYEDHPGDCGYFDTEKFQSRNCCACKST